MFKVEYGQRIYHSKSFLDGKIGKTPLISSGKNKHGFYGFFDIEPVYKNVISVTNTGSVGWAFYHNYSCCIDDNCLVLIPKTKMSDQQMIYISMLINKDKYRYMYGRQVTPARIENIELPNIPNFVNKKEFPNVDEAKKSVSNKKISFDISKQKWFLINDLFDVSGTKTTPKRKLEETGKGNYPYITTQSTNNGVEGFYDFYTEKGNVMVVDSAVAGFCSYQEQNFSASDHVEKLTPKGFELNKYTGLFLQAIINKEQFRYSYGKKFNQEKIKNTKIKLPVDKNGNPDWKFMEDYIKSLPYSKEI
ncbi:MAG: restriction endonuclease subunit S [Patescibacteria group bacterium]